MNSNYDRVFLEFGHFHQTVHGQLSEFSYDQRTEMNSKVVIRTNVSCWSLLNTQIFQLQIYFAVQTSISQNRKALFQSSIKTHSHLKFNTIL